MADKEEFKVGILTAYDNLKKSELYVRTNLENHTKAFSESEIAQHNFYFKDETKQESGSFKFRGLVNQIKNLINTHDDIKKLKLVTFSAGNYGKVFAMLCSRMGLNGLVIMPDFAPLERASFIEAQGVRTERHSTDKIQAALDKYLSEDNSVCLHPFDDIDLIYGHASFGLEILEDLPEVDVVVVCCGGGGILAGTAMALKLFGKDGIAVYGVEPDTANTMKTSFLRNERSFKNDAKSIASGLSPPSAGKITFELCSKFVDDIVLVTDEEILAAMVKLHHLGIPAEPSGSAAMAAVMFGKIPLLLESKRSLNVLIAITGGNCSKWDLEYVKTHT